MRRGIAALVAMIMTASLAACGGSTGATKNQSDASTAVLTVWADDTRYTQIQELAKDFTASSGRSMWSKSLSRTWPRNSLLRFPLARALTSL